MSVKKNQSFLETMILNGWDWYVIILANSETTKSYAKACMENQFSFSRWLAKTKNPFEFSYSFLHFYLPSQKKKHFNLGNWRSQVAWLVFWTSSSLEQAGMSKTCGYSFIEIRNNQISGPTVVWAPLPSVRSNQPASFIFQERASQFTCFYQMSVLKWKIRGLNLSSSYRITLLMYNMPNSKR